VIDIWKGLAGAYFKVLSRTGGEGEEEEEEGPSFPCLDPRPSDTGRCAKRSATKFNE